MLPEQRRKAIVDALAERGFARVVDLAQMLDVTPVTIRRDLDRLSADGVVRRIHGGVSLAAGPADESTDGPGGDSERTDDGPLVGMVVPSLAYYWASVAQGARDHSTAHGLKLLLRESAYENPEEDRKQILHLVESAGVEGLLLTVDVRDAQTMQLIGEMRKRGILVVLVERSAEDPFEGVALEGVTSDHRSGAALAVKELVYAGHENIGIVCPRRSPTAPFLFSGWEEACRERGLRPEQTFTEIIDNETTSVLAQNVERVLDRCLQRGATALLVHADGEANALVQAAQQRGLDVPEDLSVVAYDDEVASLFSPPLTAVRPPRYTIGATAADLLAARFVDRGRPIQRTQVSPRLTVRESVKQMSN